MSSDDVQVEAALALYGASITRHDLAAVLEWDLARGLIGPFGCSRSGWLGLDSTCGARAGTATDSPRGPTYCSGQYSSSWARCAPAARSSQSG
jgi:hypothetical protein